MKPEHKALNDEISSMLRKANKNLRSAYREAAATADHNAREMRVRKIAWTLAPVIAAAVTSLAISLFIQGRNQ